LVAQGDTSDELHQQEQMSLEHVESTYAAELMRAFGPPPNLDDIERRVSADTTAEELTKIAGRLAEILRPYWQPTGEQSADAEPDMTSGGVHTMKVFQHQLSPQQYRFLSTAEALVACQVAVYLRRLLRQCAPLFVALTLGGLTALAMVVAYDYQPRRLLLTVLSLQVMAIIALQVHAFVRLNRDEVLSRIAGSPPGALRLSRSLLLRGITWVALPLLIVVVVQNPGFAMEFVDWLEPVLVLLQ
jgi:hypothetical protein